MIEKVFSPFLGSILGFITFQSWENLAYSMLAAFLGAIAAYMGKTFCQYLINLIKSIYTKSK